ncbi:cell division protein ZapA [Neobacillus kokaensis]|uniref:Cell division protein ZapA n=1 Tax=Neobacillus kokaensis TaxID=2759023 RepID=A0ABQ3N7S5_9BACI|nr:cell division protein ZapA [Neobacillus kokaensis]GHH97241.1 cell division protein ZapA [Neobacillus kokaensis]
MSNIQKNRISIDIFGTQYVILGTESKDHIRHVASLVDNKMREISSKNPGLDVNKLAVLTAVNAVNDYLKMKEELERLQTEQQTEKEL